MAPSTTAVATSLAEKLETLRTSLAGAAEPELRDACRQALEEATGSLEPPERDAVLEALRGKLIDDARERVQQSQRLRDRNAELEQEVVALRAERDRLQAQLDAAGGAADAPISAPPSGDALQRFRAGMKRIAEGKKITAASVGLNEQDTRFLELCNELLKFALDYEMGINLLRAEMKLGATRGMDTQMIQGMKQEIRAKFKASVDNKPGALEALRASLADNAKFVVAINGAYNKALSEGAQTLLAELDPQALLDKHKRMLGHDYEKAFQELQRVQGDLAQLGRRELWERFYADPFKAQMDDPHA